MCSCLFHRLSFCFLTQFFHVLFNYEWLIFSYYWYWSPVFLFMALQFYFYLPYSIDCFVIQLFLNFITFFLCLLLPFPVLGSFPFFNWLIMDILRSFIVCYYLLLIFFTTLSFLDPVFLFLFLFNLVACIVTSISLSFSFVRSSRFLWFIIINKLVNALVEIWLSFFS